MNNNQRIILTRLITSFILFFLILRYFEYTTPSSAMDPPLFLSNLDITYWAFRLLRIPSLIIHNPAGALLFDIGTLILGVLSFIFPLQRTFIIFFSLFVFLQAICFNGYGMHHTHSLAGFTIVLLPFWAKDNQRFYTLWQGVRYYCCFIYVMAFVWKLVFEHAFFHWQQGAATFQFNLVEYMYHNPDTWLSSLYRLLLRSDWILNVGNIIVVLLEGVMILGFLTKKFDKILFWIPVFIHTATYFFSSALFFELLVIDLAFLSLTQINKLGKTIPFFSTPRGLQFVKLE